MNLINQWVGYIERTYEQIVTTIKAKIPAYVPEITDVSPNNPFIRLIEVWGGLTEQLHFYIDNAGRESFLQTCRYFKSAALVARQFDYRIKGAGAATADVTFTVSEPLGAPLVIPARTRLQTGAGVDFYTTAQITIDTGETEGTVTAEQALLKTGIILGVSNGAADQVFTFPDESIVDGVSTITVNAIQWTEVETFAFSSPTDKHFKCSQNTSAAMVVQFGDGINGAIPAAGQNIVSTYKVTSGAAGNEVQANSITTIVTVIAVPGGLGLTVTNPSKAAGGYDYETLAQLKKRIPLFIRTLERAVTERDFIDLMKLAPGVEKGGVVHKCGKYVELYIAPTGGGLPSEQLLDDTFTWFDTRKMLTVNVQVLPAGVLALKLVIDVRALENFQNTDVRDRVMDELLGFLNIEEQDVKGSVQLSDLYEKVETTSGVRNSNIRVMKVVPYARPLGTTPDALDWDREISDASTDTIRWRIVFTDATHFQLLKANFFVGNYAVGDEVAQTEITFTVNGSYATGHQYEFYTYKGFGTVDLAEPSYVQNAEADITLNVTGGV